MNNLQALLEIGLSWLFYLGIHSLLASFWMKQMVQNKAARWMPFYRLFFNVTAIALLALPLSLLYNYHQDWLIEWQGIWFMLSLSINLIAIGGIIWSLRWYDGKEFLGLRQLKNRQQRIEDQENFHLSPLHRFVRHPWYSLGLMMLWTRNMDEGMLLSAIMITLYMLIGLNLEERKLLIYHGEKYRLFQQKVPALIPRPWKYLHKEDIQKILKA